MEEIVSNETVKKEEKPTVKKTSVIENFGKLCMKGGDALGKTVTEFFTGKPLTEEQKQEKREEREHQKRLRQIQNQARREKELEQAMRGEYVPLGKNKTKKDDGLNIIKNLGRYNPLEDFNKSQSIGTTDFGVEHFSGIKPIKAKDLEIHGHDRNPLE